MTKKLTKSEISTAAPLRERQAFEIFFTIPPEKRSKLEEAYSFVSAKMGIPLKIIETWAKKNKWASTVAARDTEVMDRVAEANIQAVVDSKLNYHRKLQSLIRGWFKTRGENSDELRMTLMSMKVSDVLAIIKTDLELMGAKDVSDVLNETQNEEKDATETIKPLTTDQLRAITKLDVSARDKDKPVADSSGASGIGRA